MNLSSALNYMLEDENEIFDNLDVDDPEPDEEDLMLGEEDLEDWSKVRCDTCCMEFDISQTKCFNSDGFVVCPHCGKAQ